MTDRDLGQLLIGVPIIVLLFVLVNTYRPADRVWNLVFPKYLHDPETGETYRLVVYWGYDKHSAVVAELENVSTGVIISAGDWYRRLRRVGYAPPAMKQAPLPQRPKRKHNFVVHKGGKKKRRL